MADVEDDDASDRKVGPDGKCVLTGHPCNCIPKSLGHWCCWSIPSEPTENESKEGGSV